MGLHRTCPVRLRRRESHRKLRQTLQPARTAYRGPFPRMDDRQRRAVPPERTSLGGYRFHDPRHRRRPVYRRQWPAPVQRAGDFQRGRYGPAVRRRGQTLHRKSGGPPHGRFLDRKRNHQTRMQGVARRRRIDCDPERFRGRFRLAGRRGRNQKTRSPRPDDPRGGSHARHRIAERPADRVDRRPLRVQEQRDRRVHRLAGRVERQRQPPTRHPGLHHGAVLEPRRTPRPPVHRFGRKKSAAWTMPAL